MQRQVAKLASGLLYSWSLLRNNNTGINLSALTFRDFVPRLELLSPFRDF